MFFGVGAERALQLRDRDLHRASPGCRFEQQVASI